MISSNPSWHPFLNLPNNSEAASASACCKFSFKTLEVASFHSGLERFALTEQRQRDVWRWAICSNEGHILHAGIEHTQMGAKKVAEEALQHKEA